MGPQAARGQPGGGGPDCRPDRWRRQGRGAGLLGGVSVGDGEDGAAVGLRGVALPSGRRLDHRRRSRQAGPLSCERGAAKASQRTSLQALSKLTTVRDGRRVIVEDPPVVIRLTDAQLEQARGFVQAYLASLDPDRASCSIATSSSTPH